MAILDTYTQMRDTAFAYAADLRERGYENVTVFEYRTYLDNIDPSCRSHREAYGYAVRYSSSAEMDAETWKGSDGERKGRPAPKFHDRSLTVFCGEMTGLTQDKLSGSGGILADIAGEGIVPMYVAAWSPADGPNAPDVPNVILKRFPVREPGDRYPFMVGPRPMYHLILSPADGGGWRERFKAWDTEVYGTDWSEKR